MSLLLTSGYLDRLFSTTSRRAYAPFRNPRKIQGTLREREARRGMAHPMSRRAGEGTRFALRLGGFAGSSRG